MFISVVFPLADFRSLHPAAAGRLERPKWGEHDPQAKFARGFGSIHYRNKSGNAFVGENYYSDCEKLIKYPSQVFVSTLVERDRPILAYPIYRRFFFDGHMSGRFEFGFRLNEASLFDVEAVSKARGLEFSYSAESAASQILKREVTLHLLDGRIVVCPLLNCASGLRDAFLMSSTKTSELKQHDIEGTGKKYVAVGSPFTFIRSGLEAPIVRSDSFREIYSGDFRLVGGRSGLQGRQIDLAIIASKYPISEETAEERFARLFYTQMRALAFAHSFFMKQVDSKLLPNNKPLAPAITSMLDRLSNLIPLDDAIADAKTCNTLKAIVQQSDINPARMDEELENRLKRSVGVRVLSWLGRNVDKKLDIAIEAATSTMTKHILERGL